MRPAIQPPVRNFGAMRGFRDSDALAGSLIRGWMRLHKQRKQRHHDHGPETREEECPLKLAEVEHGDYSRTNSSQKNAAAQKGTANASQTAKYRLIRSADRAMTHHARTGRTLIHFIKSRLQSLELTSPIKV